MPKTKLTGKVADAEQAEQETIFFKGDYGKCEVIESYNREYCFIRCKDKNSGEIMKEENRSVSHIVENTENDYEVYIKIRNFISDEKCNGFGVNTHAFAQIYSKEEKKKKPKSNSKKDRDSLLYDNLRFLESQRKRPF